MVMFVSFVDITQIDVLFFYCGDGTFRNYATMSNKYHSFFNRGVTFVPGGTYTDPALFFMNSHTNCSTDPRALFLRWFMTPDA